MQHYEFIGQMQDYVDARRNERMPSVNGADGRAAVMMVEACYRSTVSGRAISRPVLAGMGGA